MVRRKTKAVKTPKTAIKRLAGTVRKPAANSMIQAQAADARNPRMPAKLSAEPCPRCLALAKERAIRTETVQRLPAGLGVAPVARDGSGACCFDCGSADALLGFGGLTFTMARIAVGNDRQEQYRLPGFPGGLVKMGLMRPSAPGDLDEQYDWLEKHNWFEIEDDYE